MRSKRLVSPFGSPAETGGVGAEGDVFAVGHERADPETQRRDPDTVVTRVSSFCRRRRRAKYAAVAVRAASI
jgi:phage tail tape-measure protein